jgi:hypothetical protein
MDEQFEKRIVSFVLNAEIPTTEEMIKMAGLLLEYDSKIKQLEQKLAEREAFIASELTKGMNELKSYLIAGIGLP